MTFETDSPAEQEDARRAERFFREFDREASRHRGPAELLRCARAVLDRLTLTGWETGQAFDRHKLLHDFRAAVESAERRSQPPEDPVDILINAAREIDWREVLNRGWSPCFHIDDGRFCLHAQQWEGHPGYHLFCGLSRAIRDARNG